MSKQNAQQELIKEYYRAHPRQNIAHPKAVDWLTAKYEQRTGKIFRDPDRGIRKLAQEGFLIKVGKGVYRYDPASEKQRHLPDFTEAQKRKIKKRDDYRCVMCGAGIKEGVELHVDHIKPKELGGKATIVNGQTLCAQHNNMKKILKQTEAGKKMFIRLYERAKTGKDPAVLAFCKDVLTTYEKHKINGHIEWKH